MSSIEKDKEFYQTTRIVSQFFLLEVMIVVVGALLWYFNIIDYGRIVTGFGLFSIAFLVFNTRNLVWDAYRKRHEKHSNSIMEFLTKPNLYAFYITNFIIIPLVFLLGVALILAGFFTQL